MKLNDGFILKKIADEYSLIPFDETKVSLKKIFNMNETGYFIYNLIKDNKEYDEILDSLKEEYDEDIKVLKKDLDDFLQELKEKGILI